MRGILKVAWLSVALFLIASISPTAAKAQLLSDDLGTWIAAVNQPVEEAAVSCTFCDSTGSTADCSSGVGWCAGVVFWTICAECEEELVETNTRYAQYYAPDGSFALAETSLIPVASLTDLGEGPNEGTKAFHRRSNCNGAITARWYDSEAETELEDYLAVIGL